MIDVKASIEAYKEEIINNLIRIRKKYNLADVMKKASIIP